MYLHELLGKNPKTSNSTLDRMLQDEISGSRDPTSVNVEWGAIDMLRAEDSQTRIATSGVAVCYVIFGKNRYGDVILGHFYPGTPEETVLELARTLVQEHNVAYERKINFDEFTFKFIQGPEKLARELGAKTAYFDVYYDRNEGLQVIPRFAMASGSVPTEMPYILNRKNFNKYLYYNINQEPLSSHKIYPLSKI